MAKKAKHLEWISVGRTIADTHEVHQMPMNDLKAHEPKESCWCSPKITPCDEGEIFHHNAARGELH